MGHRYNQGNEGKAKLKVGVEEVTFFFLLVVPCKGGNLQKIVGQSQDRNMGWEYEIGRNETLY